MKPVDKTWKIESRKHFFKYWFNQHPHLMIMGGILLITGTAAAYRLIQFRDEAPVIYRYRYTIWRDDDPRAIKMMERMKDFKPLRRID